jgi:hypothetical protein
MQTYTPISKEELYSECLDFCLPVNRTDNVNTLKNYLNAAYDKVKVFDDTIQNPSPDTFNLDEEPIYIGKKRVNFGYLLGKIFSLF